MKWPLIFRSRYEREIALLRSVYDISTDDLRSRLMHLIEKYSQVMVKSGPFEGTQVHVKIIIPKQENQQARLSPIEREEMWWHVARTVTEEIKKQVRAQALMEFK